MVHSHSQFPLMMWLVIVTCTVVFFGRAGGVLYPSFPWQTPNIILSHEASSLTQSREKEGALGGQCDGDGKHIIDTMKYLTEN